MIHQAQIQRQSAAGYVMTMEMTLLCWVVVFSCLLGDDDIAAEMEFKLT